MLLLTIFLQFSSYIKACNFNSEINYFVLCLSKKFHKVNMKNICLSFVLKSTTTAKEIR